MSFGLSFISNSLSTPRAVISFGHLPFPKTCFLFNIFCLEPNRDNDGYIWNVDNGDQGYINNGGGIQKI